MGVKAGAQAGPVGVEREHTYEVDGLLPGRIVRPSNPQEAADQLRACSEQKAAVVIVGGGTQISLGSPPARYEVAFVTNQLNRLLEYEPADLTCSVQAGMTISELQTALTAHGQRLPIDPPHPERATVGGTLAANVNGVRRARFGTVRDWVIGLTVAYPTGVVAKAGGKVVKNVAGYDLMKLHIGALGTLGVIVEVNLKVQTLPETGAFLLAGFSRLSSAMEVGLKLARTYLMPAGALLFDSKTLADCGLKTAAKWVLALHFEGYRKEVDAGVEQAAAFARGAGADLIDDGVPLDLFARIRDWPVDAGTDVVVQVSSSLAGLVELLEEAKDARVLAHPTGGVAHLGIDANEAVEVVGALRQAADEWARVVVTRAPAELKPRLDVWGPVPEGFSLMQRMKQTLDPAGILNPGRFVGGI